MANRDSCVLLDICSSEVGALTSVMKGMSQDGNTTDETEPVARYALPKGVSAAISATGGPSTSSEASAVSEIRNVLDTDTDTSRAYVYASGRNSASTSENVGDQTPRHPPCTERTSPRAQGSAFCRTPSPSPVSSENDRQIVEKLPNNRESKKSASSQHDQHDDVDPPNTYHRDMDFKVAFVMQRNKRVLLSRLAEISPRGRLSLINFCRRGIGIEEAMLLREAIIANPQLYVLKLAYNNLGDEGASIIASAITHNGKSHHQLSVLDLGFNSIGDVGCGSLAVHCLAGNFNIQMMYLSGNQFTEKGAMSIAGAVLHGTGLRSLHLAVNQIGPMGTKAIAGAIAKNEARITQAVATGEIDSRLVRRMEELHMGSTGITSDGFIAIPSMLLSNSSLRSISLSDNNLDDQDILLLSQALTQNKLVPLESLQLSFNQITCLGVECLMNAVWGSTTLHEVKLDNNNIKDRGAQLCAVALTSIALETLDLSFNKVTTTGIKALMKNLSENTSLLSLGLAGIPIDQNASKAVAYALAYNTSLKALHLDNCSTGYASQRHIVAGAVSNRRSSLRVLTGFGLSYIAKTLGMPRLPETWSNAQVLGFFRLMWQQWLLKSRNGKIGAEEVARGPAPPAAVATAAKIAFSALGGNPEHLFQTELHEKPFAERAPVEPAGAALLERTDSGTVSVPLFTVSSEVGFDGFVDGESKLAAMTNSSPSPRLSIVQSPLKEPERRNKNLKWLRLHFRSLSDVGRLPFHNADLWQLHQYYFSPPFYQTEEDASEAAETEWYASDAVRTPPVTSAQDQGSFSFKDRAVSFQALGDAIAAQGVLSSHRGNKRSSSMSPEEAAVGPAAKKAKNLIPRIAYYPRIMAKIQSLGTKPMEQTLSLLRQLKYTESVMFAGQNPYAECNECGPGDHPCHADIDMILLDLL